MIVVLLALGIVVAVVILSSPNAREHERRTEPSRGRYLPDGFWVEDDK